MSSEASESAVDRPEGESPGRKRTSLTRGSTLMTASRATTILLGYVLNVFLARWLDAPAFGLFGVIITIVAWFELLVAEGLPVWIVRVIDREDDSPLFRPAYVAGQLALAAVLTLIIVAGSPLLARVFQQPHDAGLFALAAIDIPIFALYALFSAALLATQSYGALVTEQIVYYVAKLVATVGLVYIGLSVLGAVIGNVASSVAGLIATLVFIAFLFRGRKLVGSPAGEAAVPLRLGFLRRVSNDLTESAKTGAVTGSLVSAGLLTAQTLVLNSGLWLTKAVLPGPDAGYYRAASLLAQIPISISAGLVWGLYASYAEAHRRGDSERMRHYIGQSFRVLVAAAGLWIAAVVPTANALIVTVFKEAYAPGAPLLAFLALGAGIGAIAVTFGPVLLIEGRGRLVIIACVLLIAGEVAVAVALMDSMGATGVAIAAAAVFVAASALAFVAVRGRIGYSVFGMLARFALPSALVFAGALLVKPQPGLPLIGWYVLLTAAYGGLCLLTRGFTAEDFVAFRHGLR